MVSWMRDTPPFALAILRKTALNSVNIECEGVAMKSVRLAARAVILHQGRLLVVNAYPGGVSDLWCVPGGGVESGSSLHDNLRREIHEETGLDIAIGVPCLINEFHDPASGFHQVDVYFRAEIIASTLDHAWTDVAGVVTERRFVTEDELRQLRFKPDSLPEVAWGDAAWSEGALYDGLEVIVG
jgi:8-oxo-dGTP diphosphatase